MSRRGLTKFDTSFLTNDGGKFSPSIRRLRQQYLPDVKVLPSKTTSSSPQPITKASNPRLASVPHQSSLDSATTPLKCDDCQKHDGLFQCCHCNQRLCIRCCNKHYKKVTAELEYLHELSDGLLTKILHTKTDLERQKNEAIEQCHQWRIDTINTVNKAHTLIIQTIHNEYELLGKDYDSFVEKEMSHINIDKNELIRLKKGNLGSLLSSPLSSPVTSAAAAADSTKSIDTIKHRIETFAKYIDETGKFSFQVKLPALAIDETLRVESRFGETTRSTSATWQHDDFVDITLPTKSDEIFEQVNKKRQNQSRILSHPECRPAVLSYSPSSASSSTDKTMNSQVDRRGSTSSSTDSAYFHHDEDYFLMSTDRMNPPRTRRRRHRRALSSSSTPSLDPTNNDSYDSIQHVQLKREEDGSLQGLAIQLEKTHTNDGIIDQRRTCMEAQGMRRKTTAFSFHTPSSRGTSSNDYPWLYYQADLSPSFIQ